MALLSTRRELDDEIKSLVALRKLMADESQLICLKCKHIYEKDQKSRLQICYCDFESDRDFG